MAQPADFHKAQLQRHCRVCVKPFSRKEYKHSCSGNKDTLKVFGIDITKDRPETYLATFCHSCYTKAQRNKVKWVDSTLEVHEWTEHPDGEGVPCATCDFFTTQKKGGRPKRAQKNRGRPSKSINRSIADSIQNEAPPSWMASEPLSLSRFLPPASNVSLKDMQCAYCECIADKPVNTPCRKRVCAKCISDHVRNSEDISLHCLCCNTIHTINSASFYPPASELALKVLGSMLVKCEKPDCTHIMALSNLKKHIESGCCQRDLAYSPSKLTLGQILSRPLTSPPTTVEKKAATVVVKRMLGETGPSSSGVEKSSLVQLPTAGLVRVCVHA